MKSKSCFRIISLFLCMIIFLLSCPLSAVAMNQENSTFSEQAKLDSINNNEQTASGIIGTPSSEKYDCVDLEDLKVLGKGEKTINELQNMNVDKAVLPEVISYDLALEKGHVNRLKEQENNLNTIIYQNKDGGKTAYIFENPVKYFDKDGKVQDKSTLISESSDNKYEYAMVNNSTKAYFSDYAYNGIAITYDDYQITMIPISDFSSDTAKTNVMLNSSDNTIKYTNVFGSNTELVYNTLLNGLKENIVLYEYTGQSVFKFKLYTNDLTIQNTKGKWFLNDAKNNTIAEFGEIVINDSIGNQIIGKLDIVMKNDGIYEMSVTVDENFLKSPSTVYPVCIDPSTYIWDTGYYYNDNYVGEEYDTLIDVGLYEDYSENADNNNGYHYFGDYDVEGRIIYKLPDFYDREHGQYLDLNNYQIGNVYINAYIEAGDVLFVSAYPMSTTWDNDDYGDDPLYIYNEPDLWTINSTATPIETYISDHSAGNYGIDITDIVRGWAMYNCGKTTDQDKNPENGLIICSSPFNHARQISSLENDSVLTYVVMDYSYTGGEYYVYNLDQYKFLQRDTATALTTNTYLNSDSQKWIFEYLGNDNYYIRSSVDLNYALYAYSSSVYLNTLPSSSSAFKWNVQIATGGGVIIKNVLWNKVLYYNGSTLSLISQPTSGTTDYNRSRWGILNVNSYVPLNNFTLSDDWLQPGTSKYFNIQATPSNASWKSAHFFTWTVSNSSKVATTATPALLTGVSSGTITLTVTNKLTGISRSFRIACGAVREGTYMILNKGTEKYVDIEGPSYDNNARIQQWQYHTGNQAKWRLVINSGGDYTIHSVYSNKYIHVENASTASGAYIVQYTGTSGNNTRWYITQTSHGAFRITPKSSPTLALTVPNGQTSNGVDLQQLVYSNNSDYSDEWLFDNIGPTHGVKNENIYNIKAVHSNKGINVTNGGTSNGTNITQYDITSGYQWQRWQTIYLGNGEYKIKDMNSGKLLSISASSSSVLANVELRDDDGSTGQIFKIRENDDGTYSFISKCSFYTKVLDINNASQLNGANIIQYYDNGTTNQKFNLVESVADLNFLAPSLNELYNYADSYVGSLGFWQKVSLVLQYIRHNCPDYTTGNWPIVAGTINTGFIDYVNSQNPLMNVIFSGVRDNDNEAGNSAGAFLYDNDGNKIDFYHLCATLNGLVYDSTIIDDPRVLIGEYHLDNLCGWAGDLQTLCKQILQQVNYSNDYNIVYNTTLELIGHSDYSFSMEDLFADIDAVNIYRSIYYPDLMQFFVAYYNSGYSTRFSEFIGTRYKQQIYDMVRQYTTEQSSINFIDWPLLDGWTFTTNQSNAIAQAFTDFLWGRMQNE